MEKRGTKLDLKDRCTTLHGTAACWRSLERGYFSRSRPRWMTGQRQGRIAFLVRQHGAGILRRKSHRKLAITLRHPKLRVLPGCSHCAWVTRCPTATAKSGCADCSTCDQEIHAPPPSRLPRRFHPAIALRPRGHNRGTPAPPG
jgi:hypothetical protein